MVDGGGGMNGGWWRRNGMNGEWWKRNEWWMVEEE